MINIDVLLKAAEFLDSQQQQVSPSLLTKNNCDLNNNDSLGVSSVSLSPPLSSAGSCFGSPTSSINNAEQKAYHKKFNNSILTSNTATTTKLVINSSQINLGQFSSSAAIFPSPSSSTFSSSSSSSTCSSKSGGNGMNNNNNKIVKSQMIKLEDIKRDKHLHNTLEKNRRAHLKECFENLQNELPQCKDKKSTNLAILNYTVRYLDVRDGLF
jgi:hypothetical protein